MDWHRSWEQIRAIAASVQSAPPHADVLICVPPTLIDPGVQASSGIS